jgi:hypothetical protein
MDTLLKKLAKNLAPAFLPLYVRIRPQEVPFMQTPHVNAHHSHKVRFGRYVERRARRAKRDAMADDIRAATNAVRTTGRALEDTIDPVQEAMADRDAADDDLDTTAKTARLTLASRGLDADKKEPYTLIFHQGIAYYTAARLEDEEDRYGELKSRLAEHLPANDEVRISASAAIDTGIAAFKAGISALSTARTEESLAKTRLESAEEAWEKLMTKVYGILVSELGRAAADSFFPKTRASKTKKE